MEESFKWGICSSSHYVLTIKKKKYTFNYFYDNEKEARKAFHNSVSEYGHENVMVTKEVA